MARKKAPRVTRIADWAGADATLKRIAEIEREATRVETRMNAQIDGIKEKHAAAVKPLQDERAELEVDLQVFCEIHRGEFEGQGRKLTFGRVGWRKSSKLVIHSLTNTIAAINRIFGERSRDLLRIETKVDREAVEKLTDGELAEIGCARKDSETFGYEIDWESLQ